jgi:hypothetical protein
MSSVLPIIVIDDYAQSVLEARDWFGNRDDLAPRTAEKGCKKVGGSFPAPTSVSTKSLVSPPKIYPVWAEKVPGPIYLGEGVALKPIE